MTPYWTHCESPLGPLTLIGESDRLIALRFPGRAGALPPDQHRPEPLDEAVTQVWEYFAGTRRHFDLRLDLRGTAFQRAVWMQLSAIPYGQTRSYGEVARLIGRPDRARAVGAAVGATPVPIIVPCHRMVSVNGALTGYRGGLHRKRMLLELEHAVSHGAAAPTARSDLRSATAPSIWAPRQLTQL